MSEDAGTGLPLSGVAADFQGYSDDSYVESLFPKKQPRQQGFTTISRQLVEQIEQAVRLPVFTTEGGDTQQHIREVYASSAECPVCRRYENWDRIKLKEHINGHAEVRAFFQSSYNDKNQYAELQEKHDRIKVQLSTLRGQLADTARRLEKFDTAAYEERQRDSEKLSRILNPWASA